jgi:NAD(P)-dependent dehydrogenase (short-subunit alcohol dehydrogenase family)
MTPRGTMIVTGGGRGIGAATARLAARSGWAVALVYRDRSADAEAVLADIAAAGGRAIALRADVGDEAAVIRVFEAADALGPLTALVNNAGVTGGVARVDELDPACLDEVLRTNVRAPFLCAREAIRRMSTRHGGRGGAIVNVGSGASQLGTPGVWVHYAATKGALDTMTIGLAKEVAGEGIRVNCVRPGLIDTEIHASGGLPNRVKDLQHLVPAGRGGSAEEVAEGIVWLLSDAASYTTMSFLDISGGR